MTQQPLETLHESLPQGRRRPQSHLPSSAYPGYMSGYQQHQQQPPPPLGFDGAGSAQSGGGAGSMSSPYAQFRPQLNMDGLPMNHSISFDYQPPGSSQAGHQTSQPGFFFESGSPSPSINQAGGSFPPFSGGTGVDQTSPMYLNIPGQEWSGRPPPQQAPVAATSSRGRANAGAAGTKNPRHQFTACGACRHRRVKCDLRTRQEEAEREAALEEAQSGTSGTVRRRKVSCTNCQERGTNCVDEYAPLKAAKQLRRGKRISEIEMLYGKTATDAALASQGEGEDRLLSPSARGMERIPELTRDFFESSFFRRFQIQRPVLDPVEFVSRYLSKPIPCAAAMGPEGAVLCHTLYAWGVSYGVDERGQFDVNEGNHEPLAPVSLMAVGEAEARRDVDRQRRLDKLNRVIRTVLKEIDEYGILRKPTWDGVSALLLFLPLLDGSVASSAERQAMYQTALAHVQMLCSTEGCGYDGKPIPLSLDKDGNDRKRYVRLRIFWYAFAHEGVSMGLKGGLLQLDEESGDMLLIEELAAKQGTGRSPEYLHATNKMLMAPINLALVCRRVHRILTGPRARRSERLDPDYVHQVWDALDRSFDEFDSIRREPPAPPYRSQEEVQRYADSWLIYCMEAHYAILRAIEDRIARMEAVFSSRGTSNSSHSGSPPTTEQHAELSRLQRLLEAARTKCELTARHVANIARRQLGTPLFEWDANHVQQGLFLAATFLVINPDAQDLVVACIQALNESRIAVSKAGDRSQDLRKMWYDATQRRDSIGGGDSGSLGNQSLPHSHGQPPYISPAVNQASRAPWTSLDAATHMSDNVPSDGSRKSPGHPTQPSPPYGVRYNDPQLGQMPPPALSHQQSDLAFQQPGVAASNGQFPFQSQDSRGYMGYGNMP